MGARGAGAGLTLGVPTSQAQGLAQVLSTLLWIQFPANTWPKWQQIIGLSACSSSSSHERPELTSGLLGLVDQPEMFHVFHEWTIWCKEDIISFSTTIPTPNLFLCFSDFLSLSLCFSAFQIKSILTNLTKVLNRSSIILKTRDIKNILVTETIRRRTDSQRVSRWKIRQSMVK